MEQRLLLLNIFRNLFIQTKSLWVAWVHVYLLVGKSTFGLWWLIGHGLNILLGMERRHFSSKIIGIWRVLYFPKFEAGLVYKVVTRKFFSQHHKGWLLPYWHRFPAKSKEMMTIQAGCHNLPFLLKTVCIGCSQNLEIPHAHFA